MDEHHRFLEQKEVEKEQIKKEKILKEKMSRDQQLKEEKMRKKLEKKKQMAEEEELGKLRGYTSEGAEGADGRRVSDRKRKATTGERLPETDVRREREMQAIAADGERDRKVEWYQGSGRVYTYVGQAGERSRGGSERAGEENAGFHGSYGGYSDKGFG